MPVVGGIRYPYTEAGIAASEAAKADLRIKQQVRRPYSYEDLLQSIRRLPVKAVGDPRRPTVQATLPLEDQLSLVLEGGPNRGMGFLRGRW